MGTVSLTRNTNDINCYFFASCLNKHMQFCLLTLFWFDSFMSFVFMQAVMLLSCIMAFFLNYSIFLNTTLNNAVTQTICGNLKVWSSDYRRYVTFPFSVNMLLKHSLCFALWQDFVTVGLGWVLFGGLPFDLVSQGYGCSNILAVSV